MSKFDYAEYPFPAQKNNAGEWLVRYACAAILLITPFLAAAQSSSGEQTATKFWVNSVAGDGYYESRNVVITNKDNTYKLVCRGHEATPITADQPAVECAVFNSGFSVGETEADQASFLAMLQIPYIHEVTNIKVHGKHGFTIEGSSHRCAYALIYYWFDLVMSVSAEQQEWVYTVREDDCWR